ncbi:hypothetical protein BDQ12DRAFT_619513, partial [Crucibulum laeve]
WCHIKEDYLYHFNLPHLDLLAWVLIVKLASTYYHKLDMMLNDIGYFCTLPKWRKEFKMEWKKAATMPITLSLNDSY